MRGKYLLSLFALLLAARGAELVPEIEIPAQNSAQIFEVMKETPLRKAVRDADHLEVRIWKVQALFSNFESAFLRRDAGKWSAFTWVYDSGRRTLNRNDVTPHVSWESLWDAMCTKGLLTLPDFSSLPRDRDYSTDGHAIIVETLVDGKYRTYTYVNSEGHDHEQARASEAIYAIVGREFYGRKPGEDPAKIRAEMSIPAPNSPAATK